MNDLQAIEITPGEHPTGQFFGMTFNLDTIASTVVAGAIVVGIAFWAKAKLTATSEDHVPTKIQLAWEFVITQVTTQVESNLGKVNPFVVPLAVALFFFILTANWIEIFPTELNHDVHLLPSPTADTNLTYAMAFLVIIGVFTFGIREQGWKGYFKHYFEPYPWMFPLELLQDLLKPITLALRLFGNIFAGGIMIALIAGMVAWTPSNIPLGPVLTVIFNIIWKLFDTLFLGGLQAFIFALLTILYFGMAGGHGHDEEHEQHGAPEQERADTQQKEPATA